MATTSDSTIPAISQQEFTSQDVDRLLGLADQFLQDWEENEGKDDPECLKSRVEWNAIRPLLVAAPDLLKACSEAEGYGWNGQSDACINRLKRAIAKATGAAS